MSIQYTGSVKWFSNTKGFGFITQDNGEKDVFVRTDSVRTEENNDLMQGQKVSFHIKHGKRGMQATQVVILRPYPSHY
ncbi:cold-shock protein [Vibrio sp. vnigr-6D03]|uniref:cold-shock protein n=1 Tax=Vibrio sp. vnigr-6D03 TaxID=2058088 RepID=UPI000C32F795|nr:cold-shock protein [Vibrio sp. vnigr-6D03]PKF78193.1 cold-shock protein [Vibrio sp. vnigr-6D03]